MKISTNPIQIPITPRLQFSKTNWTLYKQTLSNFETPNLAQETLENIDLHIETWTNEIKQITHATTPTIYTTEYCQESNRTTTYEKHNACTKNL